MRVDGDARGCGAVRRVLTVLRPSRTPRAMKMRSVPSLKSFVGRPRADTSFSHEALVGGVPLAMPPTKATTWSTTTIFSWWLQYTFSSPPPCRSTWMFECRSLSSAAILAVRCFFCSASLASL